MNQTEVVLPTQLLRVLAKNRKLLVLEHFYILGLVPISESSTSSNFPKSNLLHPKPEIYFLENPTNPDTQEDYTASATMRSIIPSFLRSYASPLARMFGPSQTKRKREMTYSFEDWCHLVILENPEQSLLDQRSRAQMATKAKTSLQDKFERNSVVFGSSRVEENDPRLVC